MNAPSAEERVRLRALADAATEGPWIQAIVQAGDECGPLNEEHPTEAWAPRSVAAEGIWFEADTPADAEFIAAARTAIPALLDALDEVEAQREKIRGEHGGGWFWSQSEWSDWSNSLARLVPEQYGDDVAQEAIVERALADLVKRAQSAEAEVQSLRAELDAQRQWSGQRPTADAELVAERADEWWAEG